MSASVGRPFAAVLLTSVLAVALLGCSRSSRVAGEGRLDPGGRVLLTERGGRPETVARSRDLVNGDSIEVVEGAAKVVLPGGQVLELQPRSVLLLDRGPELRSGDLLVTRPRTAGPAAGTVRAAGSDVGVTGAARITVTPSLGVVTYRGTTSLRSGGRTLEVPALRAADVPLIGLLPGRPGPLVIDRADPWVTRFLGDEAENEVALENRSRGFTDQVKAIDAASPAFYRSLLPGLAGQADFQQAAVDRFGRSQPDASVRAGEVLLGSATALQGRRGTFAGRLVDTAAFRAEGASWAVVAADQDVGTEALLRLVDGAVNVAPLELAAPAPKVPEPPPPAPPSTRSAATPSAPVPRVTSTTSTTRPGPPVNTRPSRPPPTSPPPLITLDPLVEGTVDPVVALLTDLLGGR